VGRACGMHGGGVYRVLVGRLEGKKLKKKKNFGFHKESRLLFHKLSDYQLFKEYPAPWSK